MNCLFPKERLLSEIGALLTQGLFYEYRHQSSTDPVFTLKDYDWNGCVSMYKIYMECESEYEASQKLLGSWTHWRRLCECNWFKPYVEAWREEREIKEAALGKAILIEKAAEGNVTAAKELVGQIYKKGKVGRPSKDEVNKQKDKMDKVDQRVISLLDRLPNV